MGHGTHESQVVPPKVHGSPSDLPSPPTDALMPEHLSMIENGVPFWRPDAWYIARSIGWWWALALPAVAVILAIPFLAFSRGTQFMALIGWEMKLLVFVCGFVVTLVLRAASRGVQRRKDDFCIHCGYTVEGLGPSGQCPECGRHFTLAVVQEYRKDPHFFIERYKASREAAGVTPFAAGRGATPGDGT
jgi:hypothetical protein